MVSGDGHATSGDGPTGTGDAGPPGAAGGVSPTASGRGARRLGVVGTMVWDTIHSRDVGREAPVEEWGGIAYALSAFEAVAEGDWSLFPIVKVGRDLSPRAHRFLRGLRRVDSLDGVRTVPEPNNRVELRYEDGRRRCERLRGGVPGWTVEELVPLVRSCDAVYVNFIAGWELDLAGARRLRMERPGPLYCDVHSLLLGVGPGGLRQPRRLDAWREWLACFDVVQMNEGELDILAGREGDPWSLVAETLGADTRAVLVTLEERGAAWVADRGFWKEGIGSLGRPPAGPVVSGRAPGAGPVTGGDPTGCGDVWGITCFAGLLAGRDLASAVARANDVAARNARYRGASGLALALRSGSGLLPAEGP